MKRSILLFLAVFLALPGFAQRQSERLDRGVVAVNKGNNQMFVSWRFLATDPENIAFNVYRQVGSGTPTKINEAPITGATNVTMAVSNFYSPIRLSVRPVLNGVEGSEEGYWTVPAYQRAGFTVRDYTFEPFPEGFPAMAMKFCWVGDLNGDGRYDFVIDRRPATSVDETEEDVAENAGNIFLDAYNDDGTFKWRIDAGKNVQTSSGHGDMVTIFDMDGDGKGEVLMAVSEGTTFPNGQVITKADGTVTDYNNLPGSAPQWVAILNGETGNLIDTISLAHFDEIATTRSDKWKHVTGHFIIAYLDGIRPSLVYQYKNRQTSGAFTGAYDAWHYEGGKLVLDWSCRFPGSGEAHQIRVADVDGDGRDEVVEIGYVVDHDGSLLYDVTNVGHGDRHCLADIDPDRPGLEHFFIQQSNILGMGLHDASNGQHIKGIYMSAVGDVGRGLCAALDPTRRGMQFFSTMQSNQLYNSKGNLIEGAKGSFPAEALWWGGDLARREVDAAGSDKNPIIERYDVTSKAIGRSYNLYKADVSGSPRDYYFRAPNGGRAAFWGDFLGDWREELIYGRSDNTGFVILSTHETTNHRQYCLMQNPAYRGQTTAKGYYQTADVDFYMAADMPQPPVAPVQTADVLFNDGTPLTAATVDGKSVMLDIRCQNAPLSINGTITPSRLWLMNPKGKNHTIAGTGTISGTGDVVKSLQGDVTLQGNHDYTGVTRISEGRLFINGSLVSPVRVDARGVVGGNGTLNGGVTLETGLNVEGGRIEPGNGASLGVLTLAGNLAMPGRNNLAFDIDQSQPQKNDTLHVQGNFSATGSNHSLVINVLSPIKPDTLTLMTITGTNHVKAEQFSVLGLEGIPFTLMVDSSSIRIAVLEPRSASQVVWKGGHSNVWDFKTKNFQLGTLNDFFVPGDTVTFNDKALKNSVAINETMPVGALYFTNDTTISISGQGAIGGLGGLTKTGKGKVALLTAENTFTGGVDFSDGILEVVSLKNGGLSSSIGASSSAASNWIMRNATLQTAGQMSTDRNMQVVGKLTVNNPSSNNSVMFTGNISGSNATLELQGAGTMSVQGTNTFAGVTIKSGVLSLASINANSYGLGSGIITLEGGTLQMRDANSMSTVGPWTNTIHVPEGKSARWNLPQRWNFTNRLTGKGNLTINAPYVRDEFKGDWSAFEGTLFITGKDFRINNNYGYGKATVNLGAGVSFFHLSTGKTVQLGALAGEATSKLSGSSTTWQIGGNNVSTTYHGVISGAGSKLVKEGAGTLTLTNNNSFTGSTTINAGTVVAGNRTALGMYTVSVKDGATLSTKNDVINGLIVSKSLNLSNTSTLVLEINPAYNTCDTLLVTENIALAGTLELVKLGTSDLAAGKQFKLFNAKGVISGAFSQILPVLPGQLEWDTSLLQSDGILYIKLLSGIEQVSDTRTVLSVSYLDLLGRPINGLHPDNLQEGRLSVPQRAVIERIVYTDGSVETRKRSVD